MIPLIFVWIGFTIILLTIALIFENYPLGMLSALSFIALGVSVLSVGIEGITNTLTLYIGNVLWAIGFITFLNGNIDYIT